MSTNELFLIKGFKKLIKEGRLAQSYLFFGPDSAGLLEFSRGLAGFLEYGKWAEAEKPFLDTLFLNPEDYRDVKHFLWQKPVQSPRKTIIIPAAQKLSAQAQNTILKISEEPPANAMIILLVNDPDSLIPTLASRLQKVYFNNPQPAVAGVQKSLVEEFLKATTVRRKEIIKETVEDDQVLEGFVRGLIKDLSRDKIKNWKVLKELLHRWSLINRFNVNKKLQLEAALIYL